MDLVTLDEALRNANNAVSKAINAASSLISVSILLSPIEYSKSHCHFFHIMVLYRGCMETLLTWCIKILENLKTQKSQR